MIIKEVQQNANDMDTRHRLGVANDTATLSRIAVLAAAAAAPFGGGNKPIDTQEQGVTPTTLTTNVRKLHKM